MTNDIFGWVPRYPGTAEIADLLRLGFSVRRIAAELGRHPSTIKRELDRHGRPEGRYLPRTADHATHCSNEPPTGPS